jgi:hypothetical protein
MDRMKSAVKLALFVIAALLVNLSVGGNAVFAASTASVTVGGASGNVGDNVTVNVTISSSDYISATRIYLNYDADSLQYVSGGDSGSAGTVVWIDTETATTINKTITFKVLKAGESTVSISSGSAVASTAGDYMQVTTGSATVTGNAPKTASSDNLLSSLKVSPGTLSPAFSSDVTEYTMTVGSDVAKLVVSATANSSSATVSISGTRMDPGDNKTYITVTAENGTKKVYTISTYKDTTVSSTEAATTAPAETVVPEADAKQVTIADTIYAVDGDFEAHPLPTGFEEIEIMIDDVTVKAGKGFGEKLTIVYLVSMDENGHTGYYIYDSIKKSYDLYIDIEQIESHYAYLPVTDGMEIPAGFELDTIQIEETSIDVLKPSGKRDTAEYYLFYGMDSSGMSTWYVYDTKYSTVQRFFFDGTVDENFSAVQTENSTMAASATARTSTFNDNLKTVIVIISLVLCVVCLAIAIVSVSRNGKKK